MGERFESVFRPGLFEGRTEPEAYEPPHTTRMPCCSRISMSGWSSCSA
jgi:hypothetical protein